VAVGFAGGHFNRRKRADRGRHSAGAHVAANLYDAAVAGHKDDVNRKLHPERVNRFAWRDHQCVVRRERRPAQQPARAAGRIKGCFHRRRHRRTAAPSHVKHGGAGVARKQWLKERSHGPRS
jgi:hypothetical protein